MRLYYTPKLKPQVGDIRILCRFAWFPKRIDCLVLWLETYYELQLFQKEEVRTGILQYPSYENRWITLEIYKD